MKRRRILLLLALAAVAAGVAVFWPRGPKEPVYQGKKLSEWIQETPAFATDLSERPHMEKAIRALGTNALPWLMSEFTQPVSKWRTAFNWFDFRFSDDEERLSRIGLAISLLGPEAAPELPKLSTYLGDSHRGRAAAVAMSGSKELALPFLIPAVASTNQAVAMHAVRSLGIVAREMESVVPTVVNLLQHTNQVIRRSAAVALWSCPSRPDITFPALKEALSDSSLEVRHHAAIALGDLGEKAKPAAPTLLFMMTNDHPLVARAASNALFRIDPTALPARGP